MKYETLTESFFYIMLCLYKSPNHGYGIMQESERLSQGRVKIGSGTMYGATSNMMSKGWIIESRSSDPLDSRKRMYELTALGRSVFEEEVVRLEELTKNAHYVMRNGGWEDNE